MFKIKKQMGIFFIFVFVFFIELSIGVYMGVVRGFIPDDAMSRIANAYYVLFSQDPHLGAIGFVWNPLPSFIEIPIVLFAPLFPALVNSGLAGIIVTSLFTAATILLIYKTTTSFSMPRFLGFLISFIYLIHPITLLYGSNGMSEAIFIFFIVYVVVKFTMWIEEQETNALVKAAISLALAFFTRYESVVFAISVFVSVTIIMMYDKRFSAGKGNTLSNRLSKVEGTLILLTLPFIYSALIWVFLNYVIMNDSLYFLNSIYSNKSQSEAIMSHLAEMINHPLKTFIFVLEKSSYFLTPLAVISLIRIIEGRLFKLDFLILLMLTVSIPFLHFIMLLKGTSYGWFRFFIYPLPIVVAWIPYEYRKLKFRKAGIILIFLSILISGILAGRIMHDPNSAPEEHDAIYLGKSYMAMQQKLEMAEYISTYYPEEHILLDTFTLSSFMLKVKNPKRFYITSDYNFNTVLSAPWDYDIDLIIVPNPRGVGNLDAINRIYPDLFNQGAEWCSLEYDFEQWRLYKINNKKGKEAVI